MATGIEFKGQTSKFKKPNIMQDEECYPLTVLVTQDTSPLGNSYPAFISCWQLSEEELEEVKQTGHLGKSTW